MLSILGRCRRWRRDGKPGETDAWHDLFLVRDGGFESDAGVRSWLERAGVEHVDAFICGAVVVGDRMDAVVRVPFGRGGALAIAGLGGREGVSGAKVRVTRLCCNWRGFYTARVLPFGDDAGAGIRFLRECFGKGSVARGGARTFIVEMTLVRAFSNALIQGMNTSF